MNPVRDKTSEMSADPQEVRRDSNGVKNSSPENKEVPRGGRALPFFIEFVKFAVAFAVIIALALLALHAASAAMQ